METQEKNSGRITISRVSRGLLFFLLLFTLHSISAVAQDDDDTAPPPLKIMTKDEQSRLKSAVEAKAKIKLVVDMMKTRVDAAERSNSRNDFDGFFRELGGFRALLDYALAYMKKQNQDADKTLDNYKRIEVSLRAFTPRIESIRRELPSKYEDYVRDLLKYIRDTRQAVSEAMMSNTVLPNEVKK